MSLTISTISFVLFPFISSANAQIVVRRRRSTASRIIAGVVVGVLCLLAILIFCCVFARRRRARNGTGPGIIAVGAKPMFGGPWGRHNQAPHPQQQPYFGPAQHQGSYQNAPSQQYDPQYPPPTVSAPPPYGKEPPRQNLAANESHLNQGGGFAPPPGPPPPAHTTGQDNSFIGGFRS